VFALVGTAASWLFGNPWRAIALALAAWVLWAMFVTLPWAKHQRDTARAERDEKAAQAVAIAAERDAWRDAAAVCADRARALYAEGKAAAERVAAAQRRLDAEIQRRAATAARLQALLDALTPAGAGCDRAWDEIEATLP
jgi:hypothetical protein